MGDNTDQPDPMEEALAASWGAMSDEEWDAMYAGWTPEQQAQFSSAVNQQIADGTVEAPSDPFYPEGPFNVDNTGFNKMGDLNSSLSTPYGDDVTGFGGEFVSYINPHGGSGFIGVREDGTKSPITRDQAIAMGFIPADRQMGDFYNIENPDAPWAGEDQQKNVWDNYNPEDPGYQTPPTDGGYTGNPGQQPGGTTTPGGGYVPEWGYGQPWGSEWAPNTGTGAVGGVAPVSPGGGGGMQPGDVPLIGYESSSNKDFYQKQFQDMRAQQIREQQAAQQAAEYQPQAQTGMGDPWASFNLPEVYVNEANPNANDWILNEGYTPQTTDAQVIGQLSGLPAFTDEDQRWFSDALEANPNLNQSQLFTSGRQNALDTVAGWSDLAANNKARYNTLINNLYTQQGDLPTPGGATVPPGYASPINA